MDIKKLAPWNWLKKETEESGGNVPVTRDGGSLVAHDGNVVSPVVQFRREVDRIFENFFRGSGLSPCESDLFSPLTTTGLLKPQVDIGATEKEYVISVEVPGVMEEDVQVEVSGNTMTIRGEKRQEKEEKEKSYYRMERSYGSFQRVLSLPEDVDQEGIKASFKKGVLSVTIPRKSLPGSQAKQIAINGS